jgi:hypothetical protein
MENVRKFVSWEVKPLETLKDTKTYQIMEKLHNGIKLTREEKDGLNIFEYNGYRRLVGWQFDFTPFCNLYLVKIKHYGWKEFYAFDKMQIRNYAGYKNNILQIVEIENKYSIYNKKQKSA